MIVFLLSESPGVGQVPASAVEKGSRTARSGFKSEDEIRDKFNDWRRDADARSWLSAMGYDPAVLDSVSAAKPHGEKADVVVRIRSAAAPRNDSAEGISIKLVSSPNGFNQIDKRWLANYATKWKMPADVVTAMRLYLGELPPIKPSRDKKRMFLDELEPAQQKVVVDFFTANKAMIVSDLIEGDGDDAADWVMVAFKATDRPKWVIRSSTEVVRFFSEGKVEMTRAGNLKIGRITMQRKGGDGGRETANMLQFKINPALLLGK